ncbi:MAG TPA: hypothetical protein VG867_10700 [Rhizomicrobium sp.]|nr:hypothetical protein [Rhizomicrobium sp.]
MATRRKTVRTAARRRPAARRAAPQPSGPDAVTIITWTAFALVGLVLAAGVAAIVADDIPYEDRWMRNMRHRLRDRALHASNDAIDSLRGQFAELQSDVRKQIAHIR